MNQTINLLQHPLLSVVHSLPLRPSENSLYNHSYPQLCSHSWHGSTSSASEHPKAMNGLIFPFLTIKTAPMLRIIDLLFISHQNHIWCQARTSSPHLCEALGDQLSLVMDLLCNRPPVLILPSHLQTIYPQGVA